MGRGCERSELKIFEMHLCTQPHIEFHDTQRFHCIVEISVSASVDQSHT